MGEINIFMVSVHYFKIIMYLCMTMGGADNMINRKGRWFGMCLNQYTIAGLIFLVWIAFFDQNNLIGKVRLNSKITTLKKEKAYYQEKIKEDSRKSRELFSNKDNLEKFAREQYLMKKSNEDIFVIVND